MRLIDADALIEKHPEICSRSMKFNLDLAPTIDAVPVVRCKDCKHWGTGVAGEIGRIKCCEIVGYMVTLSGYCVYGEVKNND